MNDIDLIIARYLSGDASHDEIAQLNAWIKDSSENKQYFFDQQRIWHALAPENDINNIDADAALARMLQKYPLVSSSPSKFKRQVLHVIRYAAACLIPVCMLLLYQHFDKDDVDNSCPVDINVPYGGMLSTVLPDGSKVWLNANSSLSYNIPFDNNQRQVRLLGEAYFDVKSDKKHPFVVSTEDLEVIATGTQFNVNAYSECKPMVTLVEGVVDVKIPSTSASTILEPGNVLLVDNNTFSIVNDNTSKFCSWKDGLLDFRNDCLGQIINRLEQIYPATFEVEDSTLLNRHYYAVFENETIGEILHLMELSDNLVFTQLSPVRSLDNPTSEKIHYRISR